MINLVKQGTKLQVLLAGAITTVECPILATIEEANSRGTSDRTVDSITTGATAVDLIAATAGVRRKLKNFSLHNADSANVTATVRYYNENGTTRTVIKVILATLETLMYDEERGWYCIDANGRQKAASSTADSTTISIALSAGDSGGLRASTTGSTTLSQATSQNTAQSSTLSIVKSSADSG